MSLSVKESPERLKFLAGMDVDRVLGEQLSQWEKHPMLGRYIIGILCLLCAVKRGLAAMELRMLLSNPAELLPRNMAQLFQEDAGNLS